MSPTAPRTECLGPDSAWSARAEAILSRAVGDLELAADFSAVTVLADPAPGQEACWIRFLPGEPPVPRRLALELHCATGSFARLQPMRSTVHPAPQIWDAREGAWTGEVFEPADFSEDRAACFLFHHLLLARDLARGEVNPAAVPRGQVEAFDAAWKVVVDGRLARAGLPGYPLAERRGDFSRLFSSAGVLMPDHWQVFQSLWDGGLATARDVLAVIRQLPRL